MHVRRQYAHRRVAHIHEGAFAEVCTDCLCTATGMRHGACTPNLHRLGKISDVQTLLVFAAQQGPTGSSNTVGLN